MLLTYKYKLYRTKKTKRLDQLIDIAGIIYNYCVALHKKYFKMYGKSLKKFKLQKRLTKLKKQKKYEFWSNLGSQAIQNIAERIDGSYKKFFKKQGGLPGFRKIKKYKSFTLKGTVGYKLDDNKLIIKGNVFKFSKSREIEGKIRTVTLKRDNIGDFYVCFNLEIQDKHHITTGKSVGMDFGMKTFLTLSDGIKIHAPQYYFANLAQLRSKSRELSCKKKSSNNWA